MRFTSCPHCGTKTGQRKLPLLIRVDPDTLTLFNYTNRYCKRCDLLIAHKHDIEHHLTRTFRVINPQQIGNFYLIFATVEKKAWQKSKKQHLSTAEIRAASMDFKSYEDLRMTAAGWFPKGQKPPVMTPPASTEWGKPDR